MIWKTLMGVGLLVGSGVWSGTASAQGYCHGGPVYQQAYRAPVYRAPVAIYRAPAYRSMQAYRAPVYGGYGYGLPAVSRGVNVNIGVGGYPRSYGSGFGYGPSFGMGRYPF